MEVSIFEIIMLLCFGAAWPFSIYKSYTSKSVKGKSVIFLIVIFTGYVAGVFHKIHYHFDEVLLLYCINGVMVFIDILLYFRNLKIERTNQ